MTTTPMRVLAAMSGGVDSAVAAARAVEAGHEVVGVHMALSRSREEFRTGSRGCCTIEDASDARRAADILGIAYYVWDLSEQFEDIVIADFLSEYRTGRTPNPCVRCNEQIKFETLFEKAMALGFDAVCTGHYARIVADDSGNVELHRSINQEKDQSYVLAVMPPDRLSRTLFPLGEFATKAEVRAEAAARGLGVSAKPDSYDICFVSDGDTQGFLKERLGSAPGDIVTTNGEVVGTHEGIFEFTIGQRKGLRLGRPAADGKPRYVLDIQPVSNTVVVGSQEDLLVFQLEADRATWLVPVTVNEPISCAVQVRAHGEAVAAVAIPGPEDTVMITVTGTGLRGVAPGQSAVLYRGTQVLGQATIAQTL